MARKKKTELAGLYADIAPVQRIDAVSHHAMQLYSATRRDMAGTPSNMLLVPATYQEKTAKCWEGYHNDTLFGRMVDRAVEFAANGARWEVPAQLDKQKSWIQRLSEAMFGSQQRREQDFWNDWASGINRDVPNVIPGMQEVTKWAIRHMLLGGMWVPHWELGTMKFGKQEFIVPTKITCYPPSAIILKRSNAMFVDEEIWYRLPVGAKNAVMREGQPAIAHGLATTGMEQIELIGSAEGPGDTEGVALKLNWSPGDLVTFRHGTTSTTGQGLYPKVPFYALLPQLAMRQKMFAADLSTLDGIIQQLWVWKIGDKDFPPQPPIKDTSGTVTQDGTIAQVRKLIQEGRTGPALELFLPYYVDLVMKVPDTAVLLNSEKYSQSTLEIYAAFGILFSRGSSGSRERMEKINMSNFEEFLENLRWHVRSFWHLMARRIMQLNQNKLDVMPIWSPRPLNTKNDAFIQQLVTLSKMGKLSLDSLLWQHGIDPSVEVPRIANELATDTDDLTDANAPVSYVQRSDGQPDYAGQNKNENDPTRGTSPLPDGRTPTSETTLTPGRQTGRPRGRSRKTPPAPQED